MNHANGLEYAETKVDATTRIDLRHVSSALLSACRPNGLPSSILSTLYGFIMLADHDSPVHLELGELRSHSCMT